MPDILAIPAANGPGDLTGVVTLPNVSLPATNLDAVALGLTLDVSYKFVLQGDAAIGTVASSLSAIAAILQPAMTQLYEGQSIDGGVTNYAAMIDAANFNPSDPSETIDTVTVTATDDAASVSDALSEGDVAGLIVDVTGSRGTTGQFVADPVTVDYKVRVTVQPNNTLEIDINPLVPTGEAVDVTITEPAAYADTYQLIPSDLDLGPVALAAPRISGTSGQGNILTSVPGLWVSDDDSVAVTLARQWRRNGVAIPGATGADYTQVAEDTGAVLTLEFTGTDGNGSRVAVSNAISTAPTPKVTVTEAGRHISDAGTRSSAPRTLTDVALGVNAGKDVYLLVGTFSGAGGDNLGHSSVTIGGVSATRVNSNGDSLAIDFVHMELWRAKVPASTGTIVLTPRTSYRQLTVQVLEVVGADPTPRSLVTYGAATATNLSIDLAPGDIFVGAIARMASSGADTSFTGAMKSGTKLEGAMTGSYSAYCRHDATTPETPRAVTATHSGTASAVAGIGVALRIAR